MRSESTYALKVLSNLKKSQKIDAFEIYFEESRATKIDVKDQKIDALSRNHDVGLAFRLLKGKQMGFSFTTSTEHSAIDRAIESALVIAENMPDDPYQALPAFASANEYRKPAACDLEGLRTPLEQKIARAMELEKRCRSSDPRITGIRSASISESHSIRELIDSDGTCLEREGVVFTTGILCKAEENGQSTMGHGSEFSKTWKELKVERAADECAESALELLGAGKAPTGKFPAVFRASVVSDLIDFLADSFSAENIDKGQSLLVGKQGQSLFSPLLNLNDDPTFPGAYYDSPFDSEGVPTQAVHLIDGGVFKDVLLNQYYALKTGKRSTGSALRSIKAPPKIGTRNLILKPGTRTEAELIQDAQNGILITDLMGLHTANPVTGDFSLGASGILIENGKLTRPVMGFAVAGNILSLLNAVQAIGNNFRFYGTTGCASLLIAELSVGGNE